MRAPENKSVNKKTRLKKCKGAAWDDYNVSKQGENGVFQFGGGSCVFSAWLFK